MKNRKPGFVKTRPRPETLRELNGMPTPALEADKIKSDMNGNTTRALACGLVLARRRAIVLAQLRRMGGAR